VEEPADREARHPRERHRDQAGRSRNRDGDDRDHRRHRAQRRDPR
jgi:hypothetical protein